MKSQYILLFVIAFMASSCKKFLDGTPKGLVIPQKIADYEGILNSPSLTRTFAINLLDFTDDRLTTFDATDQSPAANGYYWRPIITINEKANPDVWGPLYRCIYSANVIINGVNTAIDGMDAQKQKIRAEALVIRANCYLELLTVFAKAYNPATANADPGLPLVTSTDVNDKAPARSTLKATFDAIIHDLNIAVDALPTSNINRFRVTKYAAYGLLSRIYLYMADYANAEKYTALALQGPHNLLNYNNYAGVINVPVYDLNPEVLWQRAAVSGTSSSMLYSDDLRSYFDSTDIRYAFLTQEPSVDGIGRRNFLGETNFGISYPEMYLTRAELLAREGNFRDAMTVVNMLRKNRIRTRNYVDQTASTGEEALAKIFSERRRELAYSGLRWFDMKRLDQEGRMPVVRRINPTTKVEEATLPPHSPKYTFEIPIRVSAFNPDMELNHK